MATKASRSIGFRFAHIPHDGVSPVTYELMSLSNDVRFDSSGIPSRNMVTVVPFRIEGTTRVLLPVNSDTGAQHVVVLKMEFNGTVSAMVTTSVSPAVLRTAKWARFDLVPSRLMSMSGSTPVYSDSAVVATCPVFITTDGQIGGFTSIVFIRYATNPGTPTGGTYDNPVPTNKVGTQNLTWSDAPPSGQDPLWMSRAYFESGMTGAPSWSAPSPVSDSVGVEFVYSPDEEPSPSIPPKEHPFVTPNPSWSKLAADAIWMAVALQNGGAWGDWNVIRVKGERGPQGPQGGQGVGISAVTNYYAVSSSKSVAPSQWSTDVPTMTKAQRYLWNKEVVTLTDGSLKTTQPRVIGVYGDSGRGISTITEYYLATSAATGVTTNTTGWTTTVQSVSSTNKYLWNYEVITYTDGSSDTSEPVIIGAYGDTGDKGDKGDTGDKGDKGDKGDTGDKGDKGDSAVEYRLVVTPTSVVYDLNSSSYDTPSISCSVIKVVGGTVSQVSSLASEGLSMVYVRYQDGVNKGQVAYTGDVVLSQVRYSRLDFVLSKGTVEIARESVSIIPSGKNGVTGKNGVWVPPPMLWSDYPTAPAYQFQCGDVAKGDERLDMVLTMGTDGKFFIWRCLQTHNKGASGTLAPPATGTENTYWKRADSGMWKFLATELLWANIGQINFLNGQAFRIGDSNGMYGYFGVPVGVSGAMLYMGGDNVSDATFVVYKDGRVTATNMHISGNSTFKGFILREKTLITSSNYSSMSKTIEYTDGETQTELDLIKTGNWMEIMSLPSQTSTYLLRLPAIRIGVAYTDVYRDYVRQFLGNEVLIYNSSGKTINVDSGESSRIIRNGYAVHFKMVFTPYKSTVGQNDIWLEKIRWEYTETYQF